MTTTQSTETTEKTVLKVEVNAWLKLTDLSQFLLDLDHAYTSLVVFERVTRRVERGTTQQTVYSAYSSAVRAVTTSLLGSKPIEPSPYPAIAMTLDWHRIWQEARAEQEASIVGQQGPLILLAAELHSLGFLEFLGFIDAVEILYKWLKERHERKKTKGYRSEEEARRETLNNDLLELDVIQKKLDLYKQVGVTNDALAPILETLIRQPLKALNKHQDSGIIEGASTRPPTPQELVTSR